MADVRKRSRCDTDRESAEGLGDSEEDRLQSQCSSSIGQSPCNLGCTIDDVKESSSVEPFVSEEEVPRFLGQEDWIPTQRFEVVQKNKVRGCDSATSNMINPMTKISEKLQLPSTDLNVSVIRELRTAVADRQIAGWVLDEESLWADCDLSCPIDRVR